MTLSDDEEGVSHTNKERHGPAVDGISPWPCLSCGPANRSSPGLATTSLSVGVLPGITSECCPTALDHRRAALLIRLGNRLVGRLKLGQPVR